MTPRESLIFIAAGLFIGLAGWYLDSAFGIAVGAVIGAMGLEELLESRIDPLQARERAEGGEG